MARIRLWSPHEKFALGTVIETLPHHTGSQHWQDHTRLGPEIDARQCRAIDQLPASHRPRCK
eukprot:2815600-Rhodomonas_salina.1